MGGVSFPRSYHVLYYITQVFNIGCGLGFGVCAIFGVKHSAWWYLALVPGWVFFWAWRRAAQRELRKMDAEREAVEAEIESLLARFHGREQ